MALGATLYHFVITLSDVDRNVYEALDLRVARHPSESARYLFCRTLGYCLAYEPGIAFSKGGLSSADEPPIAVRDDTGVLKHWIDIGSPSAERLHKASKAARAVSVFTHVELGLVQREATSRAIHRAETIRLFRFEPAFLDALEPKLGRNTSFELVRNAEQLYLNVGGAALESTLTSAALVASE
jgi:uncharacterized protein YaeQ